MKDLAFDADDLSNPQSNNNTYKIYKKSASNDAEENQKARRFIVNTESPACTCLKLKSHGYPCSHLIKTIKYFFINVYSNL